MIRLIIADDHPIVREGLKKILEKTSDMVIVDAVSTGEELLDKIYQNNYDIALLDISMPGIGGLEVLKQLKAEKSKIRTLVLSVHSEDNYAIRALKEGASGYLTKDKAPYELVNAIRKISRNGKYISPYLAERIAYNMEIGNGKSLHEQLSNREFQVMCMISLGKTVKEISAELALSVSTISTYRSRTLEKMNMKNNAELTYYTIKNTLI